MKIHDYKPPIHYTLESLRTVERTLTARQKFIRWLTGDCQPTVLEAILCGVLFGTIIFWFVWSMP